MKANPLYIIIFILGSSLIFSCSKSEDFPTDQLSDYIILQPGKYIVYRLDSTVFTNFGTVPEVHSFQEKNLVDAEVTDGLGRPSYRIFRFMRDSGGTQPWAPVGSYFITMEKNSLEIIENNLRVIKLVLPVQQYNTWKGNRYLPDDPYAPTYGFQNDMDMEDWDYSYDSLDESLVLNGKTIDHVLTVNGIDRADNVPVVNVNSYGSIDYMQDKYAKGIGLISQTWIMWDYQPPHDNIPVAQKHGFEIRRTMIDHN